jgi:hypothetical protein
MQMNSMSGMYSMPMGMGMEMNGTFQELQQTPVLQQADNRFESMDFESAFEAASQDWLESERQLDELTGGTVNRDLFSAESTMQPEPMLEQDQRPQEEVEDPKEESDALARTAGELLDNVSQDTSDKFAKSSFLALMRRLRDKEVTVDGQNFINVSCDLSLDSNLVS